MKTYYVYILKCNDKSYYTGITNNLAKRVVDHQSGVNINCYTYSRRPVQLHYYEYCYDVRQAIAREKQIKTWSRKKKEALIQENWSQLKKSSECKNKTSHKYFTKK